MMVGLKVVLLLCVLFTVSHGKPRPIIIDTDLDIDDIGAIMYLAKNPNVVIKGISVAGNGFSDPIFGVPNLLYSLQKLGCNNFQVAYGESIPGTMLNPAEPAVGNPVSTAIRKGIDYYFSKCLNQSIPDEVEASPLDAVSLIVGILQSATEPVDILLLGSATTTAKAFITDPTIKKKVGNIYWSGGSFDGTPVDTSGTRVFPYTNKSKGSSWNFFLDPLAAERLINSGINMYMMTSEAQHELTFNSSDRAVIDSKYKTDPFILDTLFRFASCTGQTDDAISWWDESAAVFMVEIQQTNTATICSQWENFTNPYVSLLDGGTFGRTFSSAKNYSLPNGAKLFTCKHASIPKFHELYWPILSLPTQCPDRYVPVVPLSVDDVNSQVQQMQQTIQTLLAQQQQLQQLVAGLQKQISNNCGSGSSSGPSSSINVNFGNMFANR